MYVINYKYFTKLVSFHAFIYFIHLKIPYSYLQRYKDVSSTILMTSKKGRHDENLATFGKHGNTGLKPCHFREGRNYKTSGWKNIGDSDGSMDNFLE